ncbi:hypothetical protein BGZ80_008293 [Entomortierella chlamydospora]|uniref:Uncharacterized protein n=1 Tax=Entomortierella chlamydospora TaxID=101097 RepID=A0A9P6MYT4_9FUNG|nr:hypothetical protein BGZ80_008293 [Entomortierella chlamydospora]
MRQMQSAEYGESHQKYNRYRIIDQPPRDGETDPHHYHRPRYSIKARDPPKHHDPPTLVKQHNFKPMALAQEKLWRHKVKGISRSIEDKSKAELVKSMAYQHPLVCLTNGTSSAVTKRALGDGTSLQIGVKACVEDITKQVSETKRDGHVPFVSSTIKSCDGTDDEKVIEDNEKEQQGDDDDDDDDDDSNSVIIDTSSFFKFCLHICTASRKRLPSSATGRHVIKTHLSSC